MELTDRILAIVDRIGGGVTDKELAYQLRRDGIDISDNDVVAACFELAEAGRLNPETYFRLPKEPTRAA